LHFIFGLSYYPNVPAHFFSTNGLKHNVPVLFFYLLPVLTRGSGLAACDKIYKDNRTDLAKLNGDSKPYVHLFML
jgi:hypothetical protein